MNYEDGQPLAGPTPTLAVNVTVNVIIVQLFFLFLTFFYASPMAEF